MSSPSFKARARRSSAICGGPATRAQKHIYRRGRRQPLRTSPKAEAPPRPPSLGGEAAPGGSSLPSPHQRWFPGCCAVPSGTRPRGPGTCCTFRQTTRASQSLGAPGASGAARLESAGWRCRGVSGGLGLSVAAGMVAGGGRGGGRRRWGALPGGTAGRGGHLEGANVDRARSLSDEVKRVPAGRCGAVASRELAQPRSIPGRAGFATQSVAVGRRHTRHTAVSHARHIGTGICWVPLA